MIKWIFLKFCFLILFGTTFAHSDKLKNLIREFVFEVNFPFEQRNLNLSAPKITATFNGKVIFNKSSWSSPITDAPARVEGLKSEVNLISLHVKTDNGIQKTFSIDLNKGVYLFVYFDVKENAFSLTQEIKQRGYD